MWRFCTDGRRITCRPTPTSAALGRVCSGGTSITSSPRAGARHASRQPPASSSGVNALGSTVETGSSPSTTRTLHFLHVPWPPQVESIAMPFQLAASNTGVPAGTLGAVARRRDLYLLRRLTAGGHDGPLSNWHPRDRGPAADPRRGRRPRTP